MEVGLMSVSRNHWLVNRRTELKLRQEDLASALGVSTRSVQKWESGEHLPRFTPRKMAVFCNLLKVSIDELAEIFEPGSNT